MELEDIDAVLAVESRSFTMPWSRQAFVDELTANLLARYLVLEGGAGVVGYAGVWIIGDEAHVTNIALLPECRGQGWGGRLFLALLATAWEAGAERMTLEVRPSNTSARQMYARFGFTEAGRRKGYYTDNQEDALILWQQNLGSLLREVQKDVRDGNNDEK